MKKILYIILCLMIAGTVQAANLSLSPSSGTYGIGAVFSVDIILNTQAQSTDGADIHYLNFDPTKLRVEDSNSSVSGIQITAGTLYSNTMVNSADNIIGKIDFSQISSVGSSFSGQGTLATIDFKVLALGTSLVSFDFVQGDTTDCNVASQGQDVLSIIANATYTFSTDGGTGDCHTEPLWDWDYCTTECKCDSGEGDCDTNAECKSGYCASDKGADYDQIATMDVCEGTTSEQEEEEEEEEEEETTIAQLKAQIALILAEINKLRLQLAQLSNPPVTVIIPAGFEFNNNLFYGQRGTEVTYLQVFLRDQGPSIYPEGLVTGFFGGLTRSAVIRFQQKYASDILAPWGITKGTGSVGRTTRMKINELLGH